ncbi:hypothetical protein HPB47_007370 [Ixodes persulcatus]|uniref:Uncharacterized protein n=1 Tax=Ixodes persulcatus TaxID=34615 RepID=A0AC60P821_IXOPE|nr:hypothetical protein HPB47_007370 [Ixodes persulcatus]
MAPLLANAALTDTPSGNNASRHKRPHLPRLHAAAYTHRPSARAPVFGAPVCFVPTTALTPRCELEANTYLGSFAGLAANGRGLGTASGGSRICVCLGRGVTCCRRDTHQRTRLRLPLRSRRRLSRVRQPDRWCRAGETGPSSDI